jgi:hypothetical protein
MTMTRLPIDADLSLSSFEWALDLLAPYTSATLVCGEAFRDVAEHIEAEFRVSPPLIFPNEMMSKLGAWAVVDGSKGVYSAPAGLGLRPSRGWLSEVLG